MSTLSGSYSCRESLVTCTANIGSNGQFSASDNLGCSYSGTLRVMNPRFNQYAADLTYQCPGIALTSATGIAGVRDWIIGDSRLVTVFITDGNTAITTNLLKD